MIAITHHGMTRKFFDTAVHRAHMQGKVATPMGDGRWTVTSASVKGLMYLTTRRECGCKAHAMHGRCACRALVIFMEWLAGQTQAESNEAA